MALIFAGTLGDPAFIALSQPITPGVVVAATVLCTSPEVEAYALHASIGIGTTQSGQNVQVKVVFAEGYIHRNTSLSWTGFYPLDPDDHLYLILTGNLTLTVTADLRRLPNITVKLLRELLGV